VSEIAALVVRKYTPFLILIGLVLLFSLFADNFMTPGNIRLLLRQVSFKAIAAVGIMFVMVSGAIDLSVGHQIVVTNIVLAILMARFGVHPALAIPLCLVLGTGLGMLNGFLSNWLRIHPLIITLGTSEIYRGMGLIIADGKNIMGLPDSYKFWGQGYVGPIPVPIIVMIVVALIGHFVLSRTYFGRYVYAMGGNPEAARLAGVNVKRMKVIVFAICGFTGAISAVLLLSRVFSGQISTGVGIEFDGLTGAMLGGVSFMGGEGSVFGLLTGVLIIGVLNNGMQLLGASTYSQYLLKGAILLVAVGFDTYQKRRKAKETIAKVAA
jgi:ribose/xylose/arabinose/galactoside ABC-type transport system permease subunit